MCDPSRDKAAEETAGMIDYAAAREVMVDRQVRPADVTLYPIIEAMLTVPREEFVPEGLRPIAYAGEHLPLAPGRVLLDPRVFAKLLDALDIGPSDLVLDVGCGLGYSAAVLARMAEAVVALESDPAMAAQAETRLAAHGVDNVVVQAGPLAEGDRGHGPFDAILLEGAVEVLPPGLAEQLKPGGRIAAVFVEGMRGNARLGLMTDRGIGWRRIFDATAPVLPGFAATKAFEF
jgi:protein-L-isoaspartate(D-aspartate) O-methyltransferase